MSVDSSRLKDIASLRGVPSEPLIGYGLVVGLTKTGDQRQTLFSAQSLANMLERFGVAVDAERMKVENIAAVLVTAELSAFSQLGARLDVTASSIGDAPQPAGWNAAADAAAAHGRHDRGARAGPAVHRRVWRRRRRDRRCRSTT